ncbi:MAG TPA: hypothetical protein VFV78_12950, partial [Vicinamibacterales bacterium]|nr:hypothetical protein [Vicinamibacterales bacterium]
NPEPGTRNPFDIVQSVLNRPISSVLLAACVLRVWHILLLRQYMDRPIVVALWLVAAVILAAYRFRLRRWGLALACLFAACTFTFHWGFERAASDGREYFVQLRSFVMDHDLDFTNDNAIFGARGAAKMYPIGVGILWLPFYLFGHLWLKLVNLFGGAYSLDGFTNPYQRAIGIGTLVYGCSGLVMVWGMARDYFDDAIATMATIGVAAGTFFVWYITVENSMTHGASMWSVTLFLYVWHRGRPRAAQGQRPDVPGWRWWVRLGLVAGVMTLVRWQNVMFAAVAMPVTLWILRRAGARALIGAAMFSGAWLLVFLPQLVFWQIVRGTWRSIPAADHGFSLASLHVADVLFSPNHGLLATTPLVYLMLLGLPFFVRRDPPLAAVLIGGFLVQAVVNGGSHDWWGGAGFGARRFDSSMVLFCIGLASLFAWLRRRPLVAPLTVMAGFIALNLALMIDTRRQTLHSAEAVTVPDMMQSAYARVGNPFSFPFNAYVAWKYDADWGLYDRLRGRIYSNIEIDVGEPGDDMFLGHGWFGPERDADGSFRWMSGSAATVVVPLRQTARYRIEFAAQPVAIPNGARQTVSVMVNGVKQATLAMVPGLSRYEADVPMSAWRVDLNQIQFLASESVVPRDLGIGPDTRALAVRFDTIRLRLIPGGAP